MACQKEKGLEPDQFGIRLGQIGPDKLGPRTWQYEFVHAHGVMVNYHSCGLMAPFIPDLIDIGVDLINPLQDINDWDMVAREYGDAMCFNVDCGPRGDLAGATPEQLDADVRRCIDTFGPHRGFMPGHFPSNMAVAEANMPVIVGEIAQYGAAYYQRGAA